jgi:hypothetical protein
VEVAEDEAAAEEDTNEELVEENEVSATNAWKESSIVRRPRSHSLSM